MALIRDLTAWPFLIVMACSLTLTYLVPPDFVNQIPAIDLILKVLTEHVPSISAYVKSSTFPKLAKVYFPLMMLLSPLHFIWVWRQEEQHRTWRNLFSAKPVRTFLRLQFTTVFLLFIGMGSFMWGGTQLDSVPWNESKLALFLAGHIAAGGGFFTLLAVTLSGYKAFIECRTKK